MAKQWTADDVLKLASSFQPAAVLAAVAELILLVSAVRASNADASRLATITFMVVVFILLLQHMLKYFDDIIGKDLGWDVVGALLFYFAIFMTPMALPLAVPRRRQVVGVAVDCSTRRCQCHHRRSQMTVERSGFKRSRCCPPRRRKSWPPSWT